jgi:hypothetical protein
VILALVSHSEAKTHFPPCEVRAKWKPPIPANRSVKVNDFLASECREGSLVVALKEVEWLKFFMILTSFAEKCLK